MINYLIWSGCKEKLHEFNCLLNSMYPDRKESFEYFEWKHLKNPLGNSLITYATHQDKVIGLRVLQPNMSTCGSFYQPCDTVTDSDYQRRNIFINLTELAISKIKPGENLINFPNENSLPAYIKAGWEFHAILIPRVGLNPLLRLDKKKIIGSDSLASFLLNLSNEELIKYYIWRFIERPFEKYKFYLISSKHVCIVNSKNMVYSIYLDEVLKENRNVFIPFGYYTYTSDVNYNFFERVFYYLTKKGSNVVSKNTKFYEMNFLKYNIELSGIMDTF